jgi:hypothetical protein
MTDPHTALRDAVALISGCLAEPEPLLDDTLGSVLNDLADADPNDVIVAFAGISVALVRAVAHDTPYTPHDYWNQRAAGLCARLADVENTP